MFKMISDIMSHSYHCEVQMLLQFISALQRKWCKNYGIIYHKQTLLNNFMSKHCWINLTMFAYEIAELNLNYYSISHNIPMCNVRSHCKHDMIRI